MANLHDYLICLIIKMYHPREDALNYKYGGVWKNYSSQD